MKSPEEIADEIVNVASEAAYGDCPKRHMDATDEHCPGCLRSMIAAAIREAEIRGASWGIDAARAAHNAAKGACESRDCCEGITTIALRSLDPAAISAERSAGTVPPAPKPEEVDRIARKAFEDYAAGRTDSRGNPKPAPACARCGGSGEIVAHASAVRNPGGGIERIVRRFEPCPECRGKP